MFKHLVVLFLISFQSFSQIISGEVVDGANNEPLIGAVIWLNLKPIAQTDTEGKFSFKAPADLRNFKVTSVGYGALTVPIVANQTSYSIKLNSNVVELAEVKVKKRKYRNKNNPAVDFIREVIEHKTLNKNGHVASLEFEEHEKVRLGLVNTAERLKKHPVVKLFPALEQNFDSSRIAGKVFLPLFIQDLKYAHYVQNEKSHQQLLEEKRIKLDENIFDNEGIKMYINHAFQPFDIYDNNMIVITNQFVSPIADLAPTFYMYQILDTLKTEVNSTVHVMFTPRNSKDFLFWGEMWVDLDTYAVQKAKLRVAKGLNLNWVRSLTIDLDYGLLENQKYALQRSQVVMEFSITDKSRESFIAERMATRSKYNLNSTTRWEDVKKLRSVTEVGVNETIGEPSDYDQKIYHMMDSLSQTKRFKNLSTLVSVGAYGYFNASKYVEIGPLGNFVGYNSLEGFRFRFGARTTTEFSNRWFLEGFGAYGERDGRWKYNGQVTYSFTGKNRYVFPMKNISFNYRRDVEIPGNNVGYTADYSFLLNISRGDAQKWTYFDRYSLKYVQEFENRLSYQLGLEKTVQNGGGLLHFTQNGEPRLDLTTTELKGELRYAPKERFYQGKTSRSSLTSQYPVYTLRANLGLKDFWGGEYNYSNWVFNVDKRFLLSPFGFTDSNLEMGAVLGKNLPYPLLHIIRANQTYTFQENSFNMMNFMEFVADKFVAIKLEHNFNGALLNKIPLINYFKLREFLSFKAVYGTLSKSNQPSSKVFDFPSDGNGNAEMFSLQKKPYMEGSVGLGNIFKLFRVDVVKRFSYLNHLNTSEYGVRIQFNFDF